MNTSGDRLRALLRECHLSATDFAANRKVTPQHVNNWFKRGVPMARLEEVAELLTVNARWLRYGEGPKHPSESANSPSDETPLASQGARSYSRGDVEVPVYRETESELGQTVIAPASGKKVRLPLQVLQSMNISVENAICIAMIGKSMADKIQAGSLIGIDRGLNRIIDGEMYAIEHSGMLRVKYLYRLPGSGLRLRSHNSAEYPDELFTAEQIERQGIHVMGWVFWWSTLNVQRPTLGYR